MYALIGMSLAVFCVCIEIDGLQELEVAFRYIQLPRKIVSSDLRALPSLVVLLAVGFSVAPTDLIGSSDLWPLQQKV